MKKKLIFLLALAVIFILSAFTVISTADWQLTDGYSVRFKGKRISGFFHSLKGKISFDENNLASSRINLEVDVASITTGNSLKSWHAKRRKWFDAKNNPTISFVSSKFQKAAKGYVVTGKLKMRGVEREVSIPFSFSNKIFFGNFSVRRTDYNVGKMKGFSKLVSDTIMIDFTIPVTK
jgi:polyisoprenoid-binding protein YceI